MNDRREPRFCATRLNTDNSPIILKRGETGYYPGSTMNVETDEDIARFNERAGADRADVLAMEVGSMCGWDVPGATREAGIEMAEAEARIEAEKAA